MDPPPHNVNHLHNTRGHSFFSFKYISVSYVPCYSNFDSHMLFSILNCPIKSSAKTDTYIYCNIKSEPNSTLAEVYIPVYIKADQVSQILNPQHQHIPPWILQRFLVNRLSMRFQVLPSTRSMVTPGALESPWIDMLSLDVPHEDSFAREQTVILAALPFAFEGSVIIVVPRRIAFSTCV